MYVVKSGDKLYVRYAAASKRAFIRECGGQWDEEQSAWVLDATKITKGRFLVDYANAGVISLEKRIERVRKSPMRFDNSYIEAVRQMEECKVRWLTGDVPCDEAAPVNIYTCPFSERGDFSAGIVVCFVGWRPCMLNHRTMTDGRYGYIIGDHAVVCERLSSIRRRVGSLLNASSVRLLSPLDAPVIRGVCVFDVGLYGTRSV